MTLEIKGSRNYSATVIRVPKVGKVPNSDRLRFFNALGIQVIVDDSWEAREGELALLFPAEVQLSEDYCMSNNLYREKELNVDTEESGYLEKNRRVRALKLRGNISNGLVLPLDSLYRFADTDLLREGDVFDTITGVQICRKYEIPVKPGSNRADAKVKKAFKRVDNTFLPEHFDTGQWPREEHNVKPHEELIITQKLHGTSVRLANTIVKRQPTRRERFARKFLGAQIADHGYDLVAGSRKAIKDPNNPNQKHHYGSDIWTDALAIWGDRIPKNHIVYGELVGYIPETNTPIQKGHTYEELPGLYNLYVYRVAVITEDGELIDHTWDQVRDFCERHEMDHVPELDRVPKAVFDLEDFDEVNFYEVDQVHRAVKGEQLYTDQPIRLSAGGTDADEGIAIRVERGLTPEIFKFKNKSHYLYESEQLDTGEADLESQG